VYAHLNLHGLTGEIPAPFGYLPLYGCGATDRVSRCREGRLQIGAAFRYYGAVMILDMPGQDMVVKLKDFRTRCRRRGKFRRQYGRKVTF
jgi:hypothetical protein